MNTIAIRQAAMILRFRLSPPLHAVDLPKAARNGCALESYLAVIRAVDISDEHIDSGVVAALGQAQHVAEVAGAGQEAQQAPEGAAAEAGAADAAELARAADLDHGHAGADVDQQVRVGVRVDRHEGHRVRLRVRERLLRDLRHEEVQPHDQALHLVLAHHLDPQAVADAVVELVRAAARRHHAERRRRHASGPAPCPVLLRQPRHEPDARVDFLGLELQEVEPAALRRVAGFVREVHKLREGAADLWMCC